MEPLAAVSPAAPAAGEPYDRQRGVYYPKPVLRGWLHLLWFGASLVAGTLLLTLRATPLQIPCAAANDPITLQVPSNYGYIFCTP